MSSPGDLPSRQPADIVERRHQRNSGDLDGGKLLVVRVLFLNDRRKFADSVSRNVHFRHKLQFRTDDGAVARGLIQDSDPDHSFLSLYMTLLNRKDVVQGTRVVFYARIWRIKSEVPSERRAVKVTFYPVEHLSFDAEETYTEPPEETSAKAMAAAKHMTARASGQRSLRIRAYVDFADSLSFRDREKLWIYHPYALKVFTWLKEAEKDAIIEDIKKGRLPTGRVPDTGTNWRKHPFKELRTSYQRARGQNSKSDEKAIRLAVLGTLESLDDDIKQGSKNLRGIGDASGAGGESARSTGNMKFRQHIAGLMRSETKDTLYYLWNKHTGDDRSIFEF